MTVIEKNILTPIGDVEVNLKPPDLLKYRGSYKTSNHFKSTLYKHSFTINEGKFEIIPKTLELQNLREKLT